MKLKMEKKRKINKSKGCFLKKMNNNDKPLARLTKKKRKTTLYLIRNKRGIVTIDLMNTERIINEPYKQLYKYKFDNLDEVSSFLFFINLFI